MPDIVWQTAGLILVAAIGGWFSVAAIKAQKGSKESQFMDRLEKRLETLTAEVKSLEAKQRRSMRREHIRDDYINQLREHIAMGKPPPAPEWPDDLYKDEPDVN